MTSLPISWLDILLLLPLLYGFIRGAMRGLVSELIAIAAVVLGVMGVRMFGQNLSAWLIAQFAWPEVVCRVVSAVGIFLIIALVLSLLGSLLTKFFKAIHLGWINRFTGSIVGTIKWAIVVVIIVYVLHFLDGQFSLLSPELKDASPVYATFVDWANLAWNHLFSNMTK